MTAMELQSTYTGFYTDPQKYDCFPMAKFIQIHLRIAKLIIRNALVVKQLFILLNKKNLRWLTPKIQK